MSAKKKRLHLTRAMFLEVIPAVCAKCKGRAEIHPVPPGRGCCICLDGCTAPDIVTAVNSATAKLQSEVTA